MSVLSRATGAPAAADGAADFTISAQTLAGALIALFTLDNLLLPAFLGAPIPLMLAASIPVGAALLWLLRQADGLDARIPVIHLVVALAIALAGLLLGGEGRVFYANPDWQVRDAVMADLARSPWPFAYEIEGWTAILRAPLGLYLLPSLAGPEWADGAMLLSNAVRLALLLALAGQLFDTRRARIAALVVFLAFSGMDVVGNWVIGLMGQPIAWDHLERWNPGSQYSSTLTLAFWVPNHALAGWTCAVAYLLWLRRLAPVGLFGVTLPLVALWSPLAAMGAVPFALHAAARVLRERTWSRYDVGLAALACVIAAPSLWYLQLDPESVKRGWAALPFAPFALLLLLEVAPLLLPLFFFKRLRAGDRVTLWLVLMCLFFMPMIRVGAGIDFQMRASIMPLAILAFAFAEWLTDQIGPNPATGPVRPGSLAMALIILAVGAATPVMELRRAIVNERSPAPLCSLAGAWKAQSNVVMPYGTYLADISRVPAWLADSPVAAGRDDPVRCWSRPWVAIEEPGPAR